MKKYIPFFLFLFIFLGVHLFKVMSDVKPFYDWDEAIYAQVGKEMIQSKSYLVPLWQGKAWLDKPPIPPLVYGLMTYIPVKPEISMRIVTVLLSGFALALLYIFSIRYSQSVFVALCTVIITSFLPAFLQRTQALNVDVYLFIGWLGYILWYKNLWVGAFFLLFGVLSKSLLGFYPVVMIFLYEVIQWNQHKKKLRNEFKAYIQTTLIQVGISSLWFLWMLSIYKNEFVQYHFIDSHLKRVTASIEQHFGQRTFYIDLLLEQMKYGIYPAIVSLLFLGYTLIKSKKIDILFSVIFVPWFLFLNVTKTKIAWYLYPVLPQFVYLAVYMLRSIQKQWVQGLVTIGILWYFFSYMVPITSYVTSDYSKWEDHQLIAQDAQNAGCKSLFVLVNDSTRSSYKTLKSMDLVIHTTTWWGNHPSMAYYSNAKTTYLYTSDEFRVSMEGADPASCFAAERADWDTTFGLRILSKNETFILGVKP
jgi:4-amino-4-deoxy-L-arabinose transferase-like glycosyltransferase